MRALLPEGSIVLRRRGCPRGRRTRYIKVEGRWRPFARHWWETNRGPVPAGMLVLHEDGDSTNDDPANLVLGTNGDVIQLCHRRDPAMSERNRKAMRAGTAAFNRRRSRERRLAGFLDSLWYPVDFQERIIHNTPVKRRPDVWRNAGLRLGDLPANGRGIESTALGWPGMWLLQALMLHVLARRGLTRLEDLFQEVEQERSVRGLRALRGRGPFDSARANLNARGMIRTIRIGDVKVAATQKALAARGPFTPLVPVRGVRAKSLAGFVKQTSASVRGHG